MKKILIYLMTCLILVQTCLGYSTKAIFAEDENIETVEVDDTTTTQETTIEETNEENSSEEEVFVVEEETQINEEENTQEETNAQEENTNDTQTNNDVVVEETAEVTEENTEVTENNEETVEVKEENNEVIEETNTETVIEENVVEEVKPQETIEVVEEVIEEEIVEETITEEVVISYPEFNEKKVIDDVTITVSAPEEVFPEESTLSVEKVARRVEKQVSDAIDQVRDEDKNVVVSYTFDIKILDKDGNEVQPKDMNKVKVSFEMNEVKNENLNTDVYHIDDKQEEITSEQVTQLETTTEESVVSVETESFSIYTVEFTYNGKQYVLEGDTYVKLDDVLSSVGLSGEVTSYEISNPSLFNIFKGDEDGIEYVETYDENGDLLEYYPINKEDGTILYILSLQSFTTEEWLKVTIDGIEYEIVVTDAIRVDENGDQVGTNVRFMQESTTIGTITDSRVIQGPLEDNFTASMPLAEIYIDDNIVNQTLWGRDEYNGTRVIAELLVDNTQGKYAGFQINMNTNTTSTDKGSLQNSYGGLWYDFTKRYLNDTQTLTVAGTSANNYELFPGDIVKYTLKGMATKFDVASNSYKDYDVVITYSDILITLCQNSGTGAVNQANISSILKLIDTNMVNFTWTGGFRAGLSYNVNVKVVDPDTGALIDGSYYYPMVDIDIGRTGINGFANLYNAANVNRYSEQVALMSNYGRPTSSGSWEQKVWIPGGNYSAAPFTNKANVTEGTYPYTCNITSKTIDGKANTLLISPGGTTTAVSGKITTASGVNKDNTFYSGFITLANNTAGGINVKGYASAPTSGGVETYVLAGSKIVNHKVDASSDVGGTIFTTTTGNSDGKLSGGTLLGYNEVNKPFELSAATGQSVTYTLTPKGGYKLKNVWVKNGDVDIMTIVNTAKATVNENDYDTNSDGELDENERQAYETAVETAINTALAGDSDTSAISISSLTSLGKGVYAYTFTGIQEDKSIHIDWEKTDLKVTKELDPPSQGVTDKFKFQIKLSDTTTEDTTWRVRAKKNTGHLQYTTAIENGEHYYMTYYEPVTEEVPYKYVEVLKTIEDYASKNPYEEGWYTLVNGAYLPSYDTTVDDNATYYEKDDTQTSTITNYYHHILGYDDSTETWEDYVINGANTVEAGAPLGALNLDQDLPDNYRFVFDGTHVYSKTAYEAGDLDNYLLFKHWSTEGTLVMGNLETYPEGINLDPTDIGPTSNYVYASKENAQDLSDQIIRVYVYTGQPDHIYGDEYYANSIGNRYKYVQDVTTPIYYDLINNQSGYTLDSGYSPLEGESGMYIITLPAGQTPNTDDLTADGWDVTVSRVGAIEDNFDLEAAMIAAGAKTVSGAVNTFEFELGVNETIDFNGVIPMGYDYEITEILDPNGKWLKVSNTSNAVVADFDGEEEVTFVNREKRYDVTIEKETVNNVPGTFDFTIDIYKENVTPGQKQIITIQASKNSSDESPTYVLNNDGAPITVVTNDLSVTIPTGETTYGSDEPMDLFISALLDMNKESKIDIQMNTVTGEISTNETTSIADQVQALIDEDSFSLEPIEFTLSTPDETEIVLYSPTTVPPGFSGSDGTFTFTLANGESKTFTDIPHGYTYYISETIPAGWENVSKTNETGVLNNANVTSKWTNDLTKHNLKITKETVNNEAGSFSFKIKIWKDSTNFALPSEFGQPDANGYYTFTLTNDSSKEVVNIPYGNSYEIYELDASGNTVSAGSYIGNTDWKLKSITGDSNTGTITDDVYVNFTNELVHDLTIKKETVNNVAGTFNFKIKAWEEVENVTNHYIEIGYYSDYYNDNWTETLGAYKTFELLGKTFEEGGKYSPGIDPDGSSVDINNHSEYYEIIKNIAEAIPGDKIHHRSDITTYDYDTYYDLNINVTYDNKDYRLYGKIDTAVRESYGPLEFEATLYIYGPVKETELVYYDFSNDERFTATGNEGEYAFKLNNGGSLTLSDLPHGVKYEVYEETKDGWKLVDINGLTPTISTGAGGTSGTLNEDAEEVFYNTPLYDITVNKEVTGLKGDKNKEFEFTVKVEGWKTIYKDKVASTDYYQAWLENKDNRNELTIRNFMQQYSERDDDYVRKDASEYGDRVYITTRFVKDGVPDPYIAGNSWGSPDAYYYNGYNAYHFIDDQAGYFDADAARMGGNGADWSTGMNWSGAKYASLEIFDYLDLTPYGGVSNGDGTYTFKLKHGQQFKLEDIPYGYDYEIVEEDYSSDKYTTTVDGNDTRSVSGTLTEDKTHDYVNDKNLANLKVSKKVSGNMGDKEKTFEFEVKVYGEEVIFEDTVASMVLNSADELANFTNNNQDALVAEFGTTHRDDIPEIYTLYQNGNPYWYYGGAETVWNGNALVNSSTDNLSGTYVYKDSGHFNPTVQVGDVFKFTKQVYLDLTPYGGVPVVDNDNDGIADDGVYKFTLGHNESIEIKDIPVGYKYEVIEKEYAGYRTKVDGNVGRSVSGVMNADKDHKYENINEAAVPTEVRYFPIVAIPLIALAALWFVYKRKQESIVD